MLIGVLISAVLRRTRLVGHGRIFEFRGDTSESAGQPALCRFHVRLHLVLPILRFRSRRRVTETTVSRRRATDAQVGASVKVRLLRRVGRFLLLWDGVHRRRRVFLRTIRIGTRSQGFSRFASLAHSSLEFRLIIARRLFLLLLLFLLLFLSADFFLSPPRVVKKSLPSLLLMLERIQKLRYQWTISPWKRRRRDFRHVLHAGPRRDGLSHRGDNLALRFIRHVL